jgi:hypothetical protein
VKGVLDPRRRGSACSSRFQATLVIVGSGPVRDQVQAAVARFEGRVRMVEADPSRVSDLDGACDVLVLPSHAEARRTWCSRRLAAGGAW